MFCGRVKISMLLWGLFAGGNRGEQCEVFLFFSVFLHSGNIHRFKRVKTHRAQFETVNLILANNETNSFYL